MKAVCQWVSSVLIAAVVSCGAFVITLLLHAWLDLQAKYVVDTWVCALALIVGPAVTIAWHRRFHQSPGLARAAVAVGVLLGVAGVWLLLRARQADAVHVPSGPFSGIEHVFAMGFGLVLIAIAALAMLGGALSLVARRIAVAHV